MKLQWPIEIWNETAVGLELKDQGKIHEEFSGILQGMFIQIWWFLEGPGAAKNVLKEIEGSILHEF